MSLGGYVATFIALMALWFVGMTAWIGEPDRHIDFYEDAEISCWWDNIDGLAWCVDATTGQEQCSFKPKYWNESMGREDIPARCWPQRILGADSK